MGGEVVQAVAHTPIHPSIHPSTHPSIHPSIHPPIHPSICLAVPGTDTVSHLCVDAHTHTHTHTHTRTQHVSHTTHTTARLLPPGAAGATGGADGPAAKGRAAEHQRDGRYFQGVPHLQGGPPRPQGACRVPACLPACLLSSPHV
jgi:hypothetical protein